MRAPEELTDLSEPVRTLQTSMLGILTSRILKRKQIVQYESIYNSYVFL